MTHVIYTYGTKFTSSKKIDDGIRAHVSVNKDKDTTMLWSECRPIQREMNEKNNNYYVRKDKSI